MKMRSHIRSAVAMSWVLNTTVVPRRRISSTASFSTCALTGSRPENGSSRMSSDGFDTTAETNCTFCDMPFESVSIWPIEQAGQFHPLHPFLDRGIDRRPAVPPLSRP